MTGKVMLQAMQTKILLAILAALLAIAGALVYQRHEAAKAALERQRQYELFRQRVEKDKKKHSSAAANEGKTWQKYIP
jgi:stalled ribosome alternative rescue factor ArfA